MAMSAKASRAEAVAPWNPAASQSYAMARRATARPKSSGVALAPSLVMSCWDGKFGFLQAALFGVHWGLSVSGTAIKGRKLKGNLGVCAGKLVVMFLGPLVGWS